VPDRNVELLVTDPRPVIGTRAVSGRGRTDTACRPARGLRSVRVRPRGAGARLGFRRAVRRRVRVDVFQHSARGRVVGERLVARFRARRRAVVWDGRANRARRSVTDGLFSVRYTMRLPRGRKDVRRVALVRQRGRFRVRPPFARRDRCVLLRSFKLLRPVFGRNLGISYRLGTAATVSVRVTRRGRTVRRFQTRRVPGGALVRLRFAAAQRGDYTVVLTARTAGRRTTVRLTARRV
jgi:hypothetical protein